MLGPFVFDDMSHSSITQFAHVHHNVGLVLLSLSVAFISCCAAFYMAQTNRQTVALSHRRVSLLCASMVLGLGIWSMHFIGMLAMDLPMPVGYDGVLTVASILPGIAAAWLALHLLQTEHPSNARIVASGLVVGIGIVAMHYSGIAAMQMADARMRFHLPLFALSAGMGLALAVLALGAQHWVAHRHPWYWRLLGPAIMTVAIASMHYISMLALRIEQHGAPAPLLAQTPQLVSDQHLPFAVAAMAGGVLVVFGLANALLRYRDLWQAMAARDARLHAMIETVDEGFISIDAQGTVQDFNSSAQRIFGYDKTEVIGRNISMLMPSPLAEQHDSHLERHVGKPDKAIAINGREVLGKHKDGRHVPLQLSVGKAMTPAGTIFVGYLKDISARKRTDAQLRIAASVFQHMREGVAIVDANHNISDVNPAFLRLMEMSNAQCIGAPLEQLYENADLPPDMSQLWKTVATQQYWQSEVTFTRADGKLWLQRLSISPVLNELQRPHHFIAVISDVTERQGSDAMLPQAALHDSATGLPGPKLFMERLNHSVLTARRTSTHLGIALVKVLPLPTPAMQPNPSQMDLALRLLAPQLLQQLRSTDTLARSGNDQLALLLPGIQDAQALAVLMQRLQQALQSCHAEHAQYGIRSLQLGHASTLLSSLNASALMADAQAALHTLEADSSTDVH